MAIDTVYEYHKYHYIPKDVVLSLDVDYTFRDYTITYINLIFDYVNSRMPVIQAGIECNNYLIAQIYKHKDIAKVTMSIVEEEHDSNDELIGTTDFIKGSFTLIPALDRSAYITDEDLFVDERTDSSKMLQLFEFYLVDLDMVKWFDSEKNFSAKDTTFAAMLQSIFMARDNIPGVNMNQKIIASPPHPAQDPQLKKVVLPLGTLIGNLKTLNVKYGLYDCDPIIFWDMKYLYCLNKRNPDAQMEDTATDFGNVTFTLYDPEDDHHFIHGSFDNPDDSTHYINIEEQPRIRDMTYQDRYVKTTTILAVDKDGEVSTVSVNKDLEGEEVTEELEATKVTYIYKENIMSQAQVINELITGPIVDLVVKENSVKFLRPYKNYYFLLGDSYKNIQIGDGRVFRLLQWTLSLRRNGATSYVNETTMSLYCPFRDGWEYEFDPKEAEETDEETET